MNLTLPSRHPKGSRIPIETVVSYVKQIASALQYIHEQKLIHRDVKPENMLLGANGELLLSDFGIMAVAHTTGSLVEQGFAGTVAYMAPEQIQKRLRRESDQYALAVTVYEWLCGTHPFEHVEGPPFADRNLTIPIKHLIYYSNTNKTLRTQHQKYKTGSTHAKQTTHHHNTSLHTRRIRKNPRHIRRPRRASRRLGAMATGSR